MLGVRQGGKDVSPWKVWRSKQIPETLRSEEFLIKVDDANFQEVG